MYNSVYTKLWCLIVLVIICNCTNATKVNLNERLIPRSVFRARGEQFLNEKWIVDESTKDPTKSPNIIGGEPTDISEFPHQLSLRVYGFHICGASVS